MKALASRLSWIDIGLRDGASDQAKQIARESLAEAVAIAEILPDSFDAVAELPKPAADEILLVESERPLSNEACVRILERLDLVLSGTNNHRIAVIDGLSLRPIAILKRIPGAIQIGSGE